MLKKVVIMIMAGVLCMSCFSACGTSRKSDDTPSIGIGKSGGGFGDPSSSDEPIVDPDPDGGVSAENEDPIPDLPREINILESVSDARLRQGDVTDLDGNTYTSGNTYLLSDYDPAVFTIKIDLGGEYSKLTGGICLTDLYGHATQVFQICGDGEVLTEKKFPEAGEEVNKGYIAIDAVNLLGVSELEIKYFTSNDKDVTSYSKIGLIDFVATTATVSEKETSVKKEPADDNRTDFFALATKNIPHSGAVTAKDGTIYASDHTYRMESNRTGSSNSGITVDIAGKYSRMTGSVILLPVEYYDHGDGAVFQIVADDNVIFEYEYLKSDPNWDEVPVDVDISGVNTLTVRIMEINDGYYLANFGLIDFMLAP